MSSAVIGVQCRLSSSRLPGKALLELADTTVLGVCLERAKITEYPVFLLTSDQQEDDLVANSGFKYGADGVIRGSLDNVLSRYQLLAEQTACKYIIRVTADNPLTEYGFVEPLIHHASLHDLSYAWVEPSLCPEGTNLEIFSTQALFESAIADKSNANLEHVTSYMRRNLLPCQCLKETASQFFPFDCGRLSFTVDTLSDYVRLAKLMNLAFERLGALWRDSEFVQKCAELSFNDSAFCPSVRNHPLR